MAYSALPVTHGLNRYLVDRQYLVNCFQRSQAGLNHLIECIFGKQISASNGSKCDIVKRQKKLLTFIYYLIGRAESVSSALTLKLFEFDNR